MTENAEATGEERLLLSIPLHVLILQELDRGLCNR
jgi:hypothetical protein